MFPIKFKIWDYVRINMPGFTHHGQIGTVVKIDVRGASGTAVYGIKLDGHGQVYDYFEYSLALVEAPEVSRDVVQTLAVALFWVGAP